MFSSPGSCFLVATLGLACCRCWNQTSLLLVPLQMLRNKALTLLLVAEFPQAFLTLTQTIPPPPPPPCIFWCCVFAMLVKRPAKAGQ